MVKNADYSVTTRVTLLHSQTHSSNPTVFIRYWRHPTGNLRTTVTCDSGRDSSYATIEVLREGGWVEIYRRPWWDMALDVTMGPETNEGVASLDEDEMLRMFELLTGSEKGEPNGER